MCHPVSHNNGLALAQLALLGAYFEKLVSFCQCYNINMGTSIAWIICQREPRSFFVCFLYLVFYLAFFNMLKKIKLNKIFILAFFSPLAFYFPVLNSKATGQKEIIFLCLLTVFCWILPKIKKFQANYFMILIHRDYYL